MSTHIRQVALAARSALEQRGYSSIDNLTHAQQIRLADGLGVDITELRHEMSVLPRETRSRPKPRPKRKEKATAPAARDVVRSVTDRIDEDQELRATWPATLVAIDEISDRIGLDRSKSPSLRREFIEHHIEELHTIGKRDVGPGGDRAWQLSRRYRKLLRDASKMDWDQHLRRDKARASLNRQGAAAVAADRKGAR